MLSLSCLWFFSAVVSTYSTISDDTLRSRLPLPIPSDLDAKTGSILSPILIPRVSGTEGSTKVLNHFFNFFQTHLPEWTLTTQNSSSLTPTHGNTPVPFHNFIARRDPPGAEHGNVGYLTLVAHYDSKYTPAGFIGATDSAAPCAMIMSAVKSIDSALTKKWASATPDHLELDDMAPLGLQVLLLDGEESFFSWTDTDSIYGARSLAEEWDSTFYPATSTYKSYLNSIDLFVLLDLLGCGENLPIPSWMQNTHWAYQHLAELETRLRSQGMFKSAKQTWLSEQHKANDGTFFQTAMQDDHIPFVARGVPTLHLIPSRFPREWHRMGDDADYLDSRTVQDWSLLMTAFVAEYMELDGFFDSRAEVKIHDRDELPP